MFDALSKVYCKAWLNIGEGWLIVFGLAVVIGILGEMLSDKERNTKASRRQKGLLEDEENLRPPVFLTFWRKHKFFFEFLVLVGVSGELAADAIIWISSNKVEAYAEKESAELHGRAAKSEQVTANLLVTNANLIYSTTPRHFLNQDASVAALEKYAGVPVVILSLSDEECMNTARRIAWVLKGANWRRLGPVQVAQHLRTGIRVSLNNGEGTGDWELQKRNQFAVDGLIRELLQRDLAADRNPAELLPNLPPECVVVEVGIKPSMNEFEDFRLHFASTDLNSTSEARSEALKNLLEFERKLEEKSRAGKLGSNIVSDNQVE